MFLMDCSNAGEPSSATTLPRTSFDSMGSTLAASFAGKFEGRNEGWLEPVLKGVIGLSPTIGDSLRQLSADLRGAENVEPVTELPTGLGFDHLAEFDLTADAGDFDDPSA